MQNKADQILRTEARKIQTKIDLKEREIKKLKAEKKEIEDRINE